MHARTRGGDKNISTQRRRLLASANGEFCASCQQTCMNAANTLILLVCLTLRLAMRRDETHNLRSQERRAQMVSEDFRKQMAGYGLTTANILYRRPDHPWLLQAYIWQAYDVCPNFPELQRFLEFWQTSLEGVLHSVTVAHSKLIKPAEIRAVDGVFRLH